MTSWLSGGGFDGRSKVGDPFTRGPRGSGNCSAQGLGEELTKRWRGAAADGGKEGGQGFAVLSGLWPPRDRPQPSSGRSWMGWSVADLGGCPKGESMNPGGASLAIPSAEWGTDRMKADGWSPRGTSSGGCRPAMGEEEKTTEEVEVDGGGVRGSWEKRDESIALEVTGFRPKD